MTRLDRGTKMGSKWTWSALCGRSFQSKHEATYCEGLWLRAAAGDIEDLHFQVTIPLFKSPTTGERIGVRVDAMYTENGVTVYDDPKGFETQLSRAKRLWLEEKGIKINLV